MNYQDIAYPIQNRIAEMLLHHQNRCADIIATDKFLLPMAMVQDTADDPVQAFALQPANSKRADVDRAYEKAVEMIGKLNCQYALFSYSTQIGGIVPGKLQNALKTVIFTPDNLAVTFFTPYEIKGFLKKTTVYGKTILFEITENVFDRP